MSKLKLVSGVDRKAKIEDLEGGDLFEYQGDIYMVLSQHGALARGLPAGTLLLANMNKYEATSLHKGTEIYKIEGELIIK